MTRRLLPSVLMVVVFLWAGEAWSQTSKAKPVTMSKPKTATTNPKTTTTTAKQPSVGATRITTRQHYTTQHLAHSPRSRTWAHHHRHWHSRWDVRMRSDLWHQRLFLDYASALTFYRSLRAHHYSRVITPVSDGWLVSYRSPYWATYGRYFSLDAAILVEAALQQSGFTAWLHHWSVYY